MRILVGQAGIKGVAVLQEARPDDCVIEFLDVSLGAGECLDKALLILTSLLPMDRERSSTETSPLLSASKNRKASRRLAMSVALTTGSKSAISRDSGFAA